MKLYLNGRLAAKGEAPALLGSDPIQSLDIGADALSAVGNYSSPFNFTGLIDEVRFHLGEVEPDLFAKVVNKAGQNRPIEKTCVLACSTFPQARSLAKPEKGKFGSFPAQGQATRERSVWPSRKDAVKYGGAFRFTSKSRQERRPWQSRRKRSESQLDPRRPLSCPGHGLDQRSSFFRVSQQDPPTPPRLFPVHG